MTTDEEREAKLPLWARNELQRLRANAAFHERQISELLGGQDSSDTFLLGGQSDGRPLPLHSAVRFRVMPAASTRWEEYFDVHLDFSGNRLEVRSASEIRIIPNAANSFLVEIAPR